MNLTLEMQLKYDNLFVEKYSPKFHVLKFIYFIEFKRDA